MWQPQVPAVRPLDVPDGAVLLDVREENEWGAGHVPDALHIPMGQLVSRLSELPSGRELVVICRSGQRSAQVTAYLNSVGRPAVNVDGGMQAWVGSGRAVMSDSGAPPAVI